EEIQNLVEGKDSENTRKATKNAVVTFLAYWNEVKPENERVKNTESLEKLPKKELNELLANFWPNAKKQNGDSYKKSALMGIRFGLQRHFLLKREFDILSDGEFSRSNQIFEAAIVELKRQGFGKVDATGKKFVYQVIDELDKNHRANDQPDDSPGEGRMYERPESPYCPVKTFQLYLSKLNPTLSCLWQRLRATENVSHSDEVWYCNVPLGKNTLGTFMSSISKELKLSQKYTNHCIRATAVSLLDESNFETRHIMRVSGHKSESSIRSYSRRLSEVKQKEISHALSSACSAENLESTSTQIVAMHEQS
ncbi:hypothetical protein P5673_029555, partial [Acropora cervicornis]